MGLTSGSIYPPLGFGIIPYLIMNNQQLFSHLDQKLGPLLGFLGLFPTKSGHLNAGV